jgi:hypothetical protein
MVTSGCFFVKSLNDSTPAWTSMKSEHSLVVHNPLLQRQQNGSLTSLELRHFGRYLF